jgi:glycine/D-amino acid oxidase-like deaminating enzyme
VVGIRTARRTLPAASVVLAAGVATRALAAPLGVEVPVAASPSRLVEFRATGPLVRTVVNTADFDLRQVAPDRLIAATDSADRALAALRATFAGADGVEIASTRLGQRPMPADGDPIVGPVAAVPGLVVATMHAAVTLAPAMGRLIATELTSGAPDPALEGCRLDRFAN